MLYYFNKDKSETEMQKKKKGFMHWEGAVTDWMCQK